MTENDGSEVAIAAADKTLGERRRHKRVAVNLPGRYMLEDGAEHPCTCVDISAGGLRLRGAQTGAWGSRVIAYVEGIGRLEGHIIRRAPGWFALETHSSARRGERVQERIEALLNAHEGDGDDRRSDSREWADRAASLYTLDGQRHEAVLTDLSGGGAALLTEAALKVDERVRLNSRRARVARVFPGGAALKFENRVDDAWPPREAAPPTQPPNARRA
jgi:PilZ domain